MSKGNPKHTRINRIKRLKKHLQTKLRGKLVHVNNQSAIDKLAEFGESV